MKKLLNKYWSIVVLVIFSLTPFVWFWNKPGVLINGVDTNFPLNPYTWIYRRFFVWDALINAGFHFSSTIAGAFFHSIQVLPKFLGFSLQGVEIFSFIFWFSGIVFSAWFFARLILPNSKVARIVLVCFYAFNTYLFNTWENVKVANLALAVSLPLALSILYLLKQRRVTLAKGFLFSMIVGILGSGAGINPSYFLSLFLASFLFSLGLVFEEVKVKSILFIARDLFILFFGIFLANLFWILPTAYYVVSNVPASESLQGIGFTNWVDSLSQNTSLFNVIRLQGAWDWYSFDNSGIPFYIPYAVKFFQNPLFLGFSILLPTLSFLSYIVREKTKNSLYIGFAFMIIIGVFLGAGTHSPTGIIFKFLGNHIPFFGIFRSPWYIFTSFVTLAYASLAGLLFMAIEPKNKILTRIAIFLVVIGNLLYNYPLVLGRIFRPGRYDSFYVKFPEYVFESLNWINVNDTGRILGYPDDEIEQFNWGYRGVESILQLGTNKEVLYRPLYLVGTPVVEVINELYLAIKKSQFDVTASILSKLGVRTLFYKSDQKSILMKLPDKFAMLPLKQFGKWFFYDLSSFNTLGKIYLTNNFYFAYPFSDAEKTISQIPNNAAILNPNDNVVKSLTEINKNSGILVATQNSQLENYRDYTKIGSSAKKSVTRVDLSKVDFKFNIPKNGTFKPSLETYKLEDFGIDPTKNLDITLNGSAVTLKPEKIGDFVEYEGISMEKGDYILAINLVNQNLISGGDFEGSANDLKTNSVGLISIEEENGNKFLNISNQTNQEANVNFSVSNFDPLAKYLVSFDYLRVYGNSAETVLAQGANDVQFKVEAKNAPDFPEWKTNTSYFEPVPADSFLKLNLVAKESITSYGTKIQYDNVRVSKIFTNELVFVSQSTPDILSSKYEYKKVSPVKYTGTVINGTGADTIIFLENYTDGWRISLRDKTGKSFVSKIAHFSTDLYANAWYIERAPADYDFTIYYWPQKLLYIGTAGTIVSFGLVVFLAGRQYLNRRRKND